jgi:sugar lactone lactonase YvrE
MDTIRKRTLSVITFVILGACAANEPSQPFVEKGRVWPEPPNPPRIQFVGEFASLRDLGIRPSFWNTLLDFGAGRNEDQMVRPMAIAANDDGSLIFVADPDARCVHRYDLARGRYSCLKGKGGEFLSSPVGLAITDDGTLYVSDSEQGRIFQMESGRNWLEPLEIQVQLKKPTGIYWDSETKLLYVVDTGHQSIRVIDGGGRLVREFSGRGSGPGRLNFPTYLWMDPKGEVLVADSLNFRVQRFDNDGMFLHAFGKIGDYAGDFARPKGIATDSFGHIYVVDALFHAIQIFDNHGELLLSLGGQGQGVGEFWLPNGIFITRTNLIFVADSYNKRVQVFRYVGPDS